MHYGLIPEFVGRLPVISAIHQLTRDDLITDPDGAAQRARQAVPALLQLRRDRAALRRGRARLGRRQGARARHRRARPALDPRGDPARGAVRAAVPRRRDQVRRDEGDGREEPQADPRHRGREGGPDAPEARAPQAAPPRPSSARSRPSAPRDRLRSAWRRCAARHARCTEGPTVRPVPRMAPSYFSDVLGGGVLPLVAGRRRQQVVPKRRGDRRHGAARGRRRGRHRPRRAARRRGGEHGRCSSSTERRASTTSAPTRDGASTSARCGSIRSRASTACRETIWRIGR